jgi:FixJ family two-component response regulator
MSGLSSQEKQVLDFRLTAADDKVTAANLKISVDQVRVIKSRVKKKREKAQALLKDTKKYAPILYPKRKGE